MALTYFSSLRVFGARKHVSKPPARALGLRAGDWVEVRPLEDILAGLDAQGCLDAMPFMPEMARFCGQRFQVFRTAHKTCDTIHSFTGRRLEDAVHLAGLRCEGGFHGGCQAGCLIFWKEAWLRRVDGAGDAENVGCAHARDETEAARDSVARLARQARLDDTPAGEPRYRCQATELLRATAPLNLFDPRNYLRDVIAGNFGVWALLRGLAFSFYDKLHRRYGGRHFRRRAAKSERPVERLDLQPGELVQVRSKAEILATLDDGVHNRGLSFDAEMAPYCGRTMRVLRRVDHILEEKSGRMLRLKKDCIILEDVVCSGLRCGIRRLGCSKSVYPFWREAWLRRVESEPDQTAGQATANVGCDGCSHGELHTRHDSAVPTRFGAAG
jgi:hypothetical protein